MCGCDASVLQHNDHMYFDIIYNLSEPGQATGPEQDAVPVYRLRCLHCHAEHDHGEQWSD